MFYRAIANAGVRVPLEWAYEFDHPALNTVTEEIIEKHQREGSLRARGVEVVGAALSYDPNRLSLYTKFQSNLQ